MAARIGEGARLTQLLRLHDLDTNTLLDVAVRWGGAATWGCRETHPPCSLATLEEIIL